MKKIILALLSVCLILLCIFSVCACADSTPDTNAPSRLKIDSDTLELKWAKMSGIRGYEVRISGDERIRSVKAPLYNLTYLEPGTYTIDVRALNINTELEPSEWSSIEFTREAESGLKFKLINNNSEYEVVGTGTATGNVIMETEYRGKPVTSIADKAFSKNRQITGVVIGNNVKTIGKSAFANCTELTSVTIPANVTKIGSQAFQSCKKLTSVIIPGSIAEIPESTFSRCELLTSVSFGEGVTSIGESAFADCTALAEVIFSNSVKTIAQYGFTNCSALTSVKLGTGMETIASSAFFNCSGLTSLDLGATKDIGVDAFGNCKSLTTLVIPDSVVTIGAQSFAGCEAIASISIGKGVKQIGSFAFYSTKLHTDFFSANKEESADDGGTAATVSKAEDIFYVDGWLIEPKYRDLTAYQIKEGTFGIADNAFQSCKELLKIDLYGIKYIGNAAFAICPELYRVNTNDALLEIADYAFYQCGSLHTVILGNSLTHIGNSAFEECASLGDDGINLPDTVSFIGGNAFLKTAAHDNTTFDDPIAYIDDWAVAIHTPANQFQVYLNQINIRNGTRAIANYAFSEAPLFCGVLFPDSLEYIGRGAFYGCYGLAGIGGSQNLKKIDDYAFSGCRGLWAYATPSEKGVANFPPTLEYIGRSAFYQCEALIGIKIPASVEYIGDYAFYGCINLGDGGNIWASIEDMKNGAPTLKGPVLFQEGSLKYLGERAFQGCSGIVEVELPASLEYIGSRAFHSCTKLQSVKFGDGKAAVDIPDYTFYNCENLKHLTISKNIRSIGSHAFKGCKALESIVMGEQLESIGNYAFYGCENVKEIVFSISVKTIGNYAFKGCVRVDSVVLPTTIETIGKHAFYGLNAATFFAEPDSIKPYWNERWNSSYRAILWGCTLSEDKSYVVSFIKNTNTYDNLSSPDATLTPEREGYTFAGWATEAGSSEVTYTADRLAEVPEGTTLYSVWNENTIATE